jgi:CHRD domain
MEDLKNGPAGTPVCPNPSGTVTGTITSASVVGPTGQGVTAGNFGAVLAALQSDTAYGNIHAANFPGGEIRGQIVPSEGELHHGRA